MAMTAFGVFLPAVTTQAQNARHRRRVSAGRGRILSILGGPPHPWFGSFDAAGAVPLAAVMAACFVLATGSYLLGRNGSGP
ncbi:MAG: hypothetical protein QOE59_1708 [Actinomycetota bacterium]|jgi:hypothetical protein|nr:hypothetical protein [Actinomycetota bacterium]